MKRMKTKIFQDSMIRKTSVDLKINELTQINEDKVQSKPIIMKLTLPKSLSELQRSKGLPEKILWDNSNIELKNFKLFMLNESDQLLKSFIIIINMVCISVRVDKDKIILCK